MLLRAILGGGLFRRDQFYREGVPPLSTMPWAYGSGSITQDEAVRVAAIHSCCSLLADSVSTLPAGVFVRRSGARIPIERPDWLDTPVPADPSITRIDHFSQVMWSQTLDGNSFTLVLPDVGDPAELRVLNPTKVTCKRGPVYELAMDGGGRETVGPDQLIHIARSRRPGDLRGMSPAQEAGTTFAMKKAAERFSERVFNQGIFLTGQLLLPGPAEPPVIEQIRDEFSRQYAGAENAGRPGIFANGAKWDVPHLNLQEMQLMELHRWAKLEAAGLWRVPPYLIGVVAEGAMAYASVEAQGLDFERYTIRSYVERIEAGYGRLIPGRETFLKLSTDGFLQADFKTRMEGYEIALRSKFRKVDEVRALEDLAPYGEDGGGGFLETPNNNPPQRTAA